MDGAYWAEFIASGRPQPEQQLPRRKHATIVPMVLALFAMRLLEVMFFVGLAGSSVVVLISFFEDGKELFGKDEK
jgi:hypothetical protein